MTNFEDIEIKDVIPEEVTEPSSNGLYSVPFALSCQPPTEWSEEFRHYWDTYSTFRNPAHRQGIASVKGSKIILTETTIEQVEEYYARTLSEVVESTNAAYRKLVAQAEAAQQQEQALRDEHKQHVEEVSKRIKFDPNKDGE